MSGESGVFWSDKVEKALVGAFLDEPARVIPAMIERGVVSDWWFEGKNRVLFDVAMKRFEKNEAVDFTSVAVDVEKNAEWVGLFGDDSGIHLYVSECLDACGSSLHAEFYVCELEKFYLKREGVKRAGELQKQLRASDDPGPVLMGVSELFSGLLVKRDVLKSNLDTMLDEVALWEQLREDRMAGKERVLDGLSLGIDELDEIVCGAKSGLYIIGGRPSEGKTTLADQLMHNIAVIHGTVGLATLDMTRERMLRRAICREAGVSLGKLSLGYAGKMQLAKCREAAEVIGRRPIHITDRLRDIRSICSWGRMLACKNGLKALFVDHATLVKGGDDIAQWNQRAVVEHVSGSLKALSIELKISVFLLAQLSRSPMKENRYPRMDDLRESGALEQDANVVIIVYKDKNKDLHGKNLRGSWIDVQKSQDGAQGAVAVWQHAPYFRFEVAEWTYDEEGNGNPFGNPPGDLNADDPDSSDHEPKIPVKQGPGVMQGEFGLEPESLDDDGRFGDYA